MTKRKVGPHVQRRSVVINIRNGREKVRKKYKSKMLSAFQEIADKEADAISKEANKILSERSDKKLESFINEFYNDFEPVISELFAPVGLKYAEAMRFIVEKEVDQELTADELAELIEEIQYYLDGAASQYVGYSKKFLLSALEKSVESVVERVESWRENRPEMAKDEHMTGIESLTAFSVVLMTGYRLKWYAVGKSCPICKKLNGRTVLKKTSFFNKAGEEFKDTAGSVAVFRQTKYPPIHKGCDCIVAAG